MFVKNGCAQLFLPGVSCGKLPEIFCRNAHFLGNLADGISVQIEISFRHVHLYLFLCLECNNRMAVLITLVHSYGCDEVLRDFSLFKQAGDCSHDTLLFSFDHFLNLVYDYLVQSLLLLYRCSGRHYCNFHNCCI